MRVFIALSLPQYIKQTIGDFLEHLKLKKYNAKFTNVENLHITVKFIGEFDAHNIDSLSEHLNHIAMQHKPFEVNLNKCGIFKNLENPRILWIGQDENVSFESIALSIDQLFAKEIHTLHITIARMKNISQHQAKELLNLTNDFLSRNNLAFKVNEFSLFESILKSPSPIYRQIKNFSLQT